MASRGTKTTTRPSLGGGPIRKVPPGGSSAVKKAPTSATPGIARVKKAAIVVPEGATAKTRSSSGVGNGVGAARWGTAASRSSTSAQHHAALPISSRGARSISPGPSHFSPNMYPRLNGAGNPARPASVSVSDPTARPGFSRPNAAAAPKSAMAKDTSKSKGDAPKPVSKTVAVSTPTRGGDAQDANGGSTPAQYARAAGMHGANPGTSSSRSVTASPAAARRLPEKQLRRSMSPAAVYRKQAVPVPYHRAETNTSHPTTSNVPPLKICRVERSLTLSSDDRGESIAKDHATGDDANKSHAPHANTARERGVKAGAKGSSPVHDRDAAHIVVAGRGQPSSPGVKRDNRDSSPMAGARSLNSSRAMQDAGGKVSKSGTSRDSMAKAVRDRDRDKSRERDLGIARANESRERESSAPPATITTSAKTATSMAARGGSFARGTTSSAGASYSHHSHTQSHTHTHQGPHVIDASENTQVCTTLSSLVSLSDSASTVVFDAADMHSLAGTVAQAPHGGRGATTSESHRRVCDAWLTERPSGVAAKHPTALAEDEEEMVSDHDLRTSPLLSLTDAVRDGRAIASTHRTSGVLTGTGSKKLMRVAARNASKVVGMRAHDTLLRAFNDAGGGAAPRSQEALCNRLFALAAETGGSPYATLREAALYKLARVPHRARTRAGSPDFSSILRDLWGAGIPIQIAAPAGKATASGDAGGGLASTELLWALDDIHTVAHPPEPATLFAFLARSLSDAFTGLKASPAFRQHMERLPPGFLGLLDNHCAEGVFVINLGAVLVLVGRVSPGVLEFATASGFSVCACDKHAEEAVRSGGPAATGPPLTPGAIARRAGGGDVYLTTADAGGDARTEKKSGVFTTMRAALVGGDAAAHAAAVALFSARKASLVLSRAYGEVVVRDFFGEFIPGVRAEFARVAPAAMSQEESRFVARIQDKLGRCVAALHTTTAAALRGLLTKELSRSVEDRVGKIHTAAMEEAMAALRSDALLSRRHHGVLTGPFLSTAASVVESIEAGIVPALDELALKAWDIAALELSEQVHAPMSFSDAAIDRLVRTAASHIPKLLPALLPDLDSSGGFRSAPTLPAIAELTPSALFAHVLHLSTDALSTTVLTQFADGLRSAITRVIDDTCRSSAIDAADAPKVVLDVFVRCLLEIFALERKVLAPVGGRLRGTFYAGIIEAVVPVIAEGLKAGEEQRLKDIIEVEIGAPRDALARAFGATRSPVRVVVALLSALLSHAVQAGLARHLQGGGSPSSTWSSQPTRAAVLAGVERDFHTAIQHFVQHLKAFPSGAAGATWDTLHAHICGYNAKYFNAPVAFGGVFGHLRRLGSKLPPNESFMAMFVEALGEVQACRVAEYIVRRATGGCLERVLTCGLSVGYVQGESVGSVAHFGLPCVPGAVSADGGLANAGVVLAANATVLPDSDMTLALLAVRLSEGVGAEAAADDFLEWPPRLRFALTVPARKAGAGQAMLRFDAQGSTCMVTAAMDTQVPITPADVVAREESRDGCVCLSLGAGEYTALVCNAGGRSKLRLIDETGSTPVGGDVQHLPVMKHTTHTVAATPRTHLCNAALGPLASPLWATLPQFALSTRGGGQRVIVLHGRAACFAVFRGASRVKSLTTASLPIAVCHAQPTPFGDLAWTTLPDGTDDVILIPYVPGNQDSKFTVSHRDGTTVVVSSIAPEMHPPAVVSRVWSPRELADPNDLPQYALTVRAPCCPIISVHSSTAAGADGGGGSVVWYIHGPSGDEMVQCTGGKGVAATSVHLSPGIYVLSIMSDVGPSQDVAYDVSTSAPVGELLVTTLGAATHLHRSDWRSGTGHHDPASPFFYRNPQYRLAVPPGDGKTEVRVEVECSVNHPHLQPLVVVLDRPVEVGECVDIAAKKRNVIAQSAPWGVTGAASSSSPASPTTAVKRVGVEFVSPTDVVYTVLVGLVLTDANGAAAGAPVGPPSVTGSFTLLSHVRDGHTCTSAGDWRDDHIDGAWDAEAGRAGGSAHRKFENPQYAVSLRRGARAALRLGAFNLGDVTLFVVPGDNTRPNEDALICKQASSALKKDEKLAEAFVDLAVTGDSDRHFIVTCATKTPGTDGSFQLSVYSDSPTAPVVRAL